MKPQQNWQDWQGWAANSAQTDYLNGQIDVFCPNFGRLFGRVVGLVAHDYCLHVKTASTQHMGVDFANQTMVGQASPYVPQDGSDPTIFKFPLGFAFAPGRELLPGGAVGLRCVPEIGNSATSVFVSFWPRRGLPNPQVPTF